MQPFRPRGGAQAPALGNINADTIKRAEEAVGRLAEQYKGWVRGDIEKLRECLENAAAGGDAETDAFKQIRAIAHDMRGQGTTFGFPLVTRLAKSISQLLKEGQRGEAAVAALSAHVAAVEATIEGDVVDAASADARHIVETLEAAIGRGVE